MNQLMKSDGLLYCQALKDIQETLQGKELVESIIYQGKNVNNCTTAV